MFSRRMGKLTYHLGLYVLTNPPEIPEGWKTRGQAFVTANTGLAWRYIGLADDIARKKLEPIAKKIQAELESSFSLKATSGFDIPVPANRAYRPYQAAGIEYTEDRDTVLNADAPRLGKTVQAMGQSNRLAKVWRKRKMSMIIFTPAVAKEHWRREAEAWKTHDSTVKKVVGRKDKLDADINIMNWELVPDYGRELHEREFDFAIGDEAHALSNEESQRSKIILGVKGKGTRLRARKRLFLTGTPIFTKPWNIFPLVRACDPDRLGKSPYEFGTRYCGAMDGGEHSRFDPSTGTNLEELQIRMRRTFMVRREKRDVVNEIPSIRERIVFDAAGFEALLREEESTLRTAIQDDTRSLREVLNDFENQSTHKFSQNGVGNSYEALSLAKVPLVTDVVRELLDSRPEEKFIIFAHHRAVVEAYAAAFPDGVFVIGGLGDNKRQAAIDRFREDPTARTAVVSIMAAGAAISLAAADTAIYAELVRSPGAMMQSEERFWLPEKLTKCAIYWAVVEGSIDDAYIDILEERRDMIARATDRSRLVGTP